MWSHWARLRFLQRFREDVDAYLGAVRYEAFPFRVVESDEATRLRAAIEPRQARARAIVLALKGPSPRRLAPGETPGAMVEIGLVRDLFDLHRHSIRPEELQDLLAEVERHYAAGRGAAWRRTLNPFYWLDMVLSVAEVLPFLPLRLVGQSPGRAARTTVGRTVRWWVRLVVLLVGVYWGLRGVGLLDDAHHVSDGVLTRVPWLDRALGHP